jgi:hypothetical protein
VRVALVLAMGLAACSSGVELEDARLSDADWVLHEAEPEPCGMAFDPDPELLAATEAAAKRWSAATGCDVRIEAGGVPIVLAEPQDVRDESGTPKRAITEVRDGLPVRIAYRRGPLLPWTVETMLTHEMGHALGMREHTQTGLMAETTELGAPIDAESLAGVCAVLECSAFVPESPLSTS